MTSNQLPQRISGVIVGTIVLSLVTIGVSLLLMSRALDSQAQSSTLAQVEQARTDIVREARVLTLDHAKSEAAAPIFHVGDIGWLSENIGASATVGVSYQIASIWGGSIGRELTWVKGGPAEPQSGLIDALMLEKVEAGLRRLPLNISEGVEFFAWRGGTLYAIAAARVEPDAPAAVANLISRDSRTPRILLAREVTGATLARLSQDGHLASLTIVRSREPDSTALPLLGGDGRPVAYLSWPTPQPGTDMLYRMALPILAVALVTTLLAVAGMTFVRRQAENLVAAEQQATFASLTDSLTGLPNRAVFKEALSRPAAAHERAVLFLDINGFKRINDSLGHAAGDQVIIEVAHRLRKISDPDPDCILARISGDEFVFVVTGPNSGPRTTALTRAVEKSLTHSMTVLGRRIKLRAAMGYAVQRDSDTTGDALVRQADLAMYEAKRQKDGGAVAFTEMLEQVFRDAATIERGLRKALNDGTELSVAYQPIVDMRGRMVRAEALARWHSPELGSVPPDRFISVAEQAGLIGELGHCIFRIVCDDLVAHPGLRVSVNVSSVELMAPDFVSRHLAEIEARHIDPSRVEIELTEGVVVDDPKLAAQRLNELHEAGFSTALDDFGTGYSSIGYLEQLPFDTLKVDRRFASNIGSGGSRLGMLNAMILMAQNLKLSVVCEGVEDQLGMDTLLDLGCDLAQGFHIARPQPIARLADEWLSHPDRISLEPQDWAALEDVAPTLNEDQPRAHDEEPITASGRSGRIA